MARFRLLLVMMLFVAGCVPVTKAQSPPPAAPQQEDSHWLDLSLGSPLIDWFNATAHPNDIARVDHVSQVDMLDDIEVGRKLVVFKSAHDAERLVPRLVGKMDMIGYNLEHGPANPPDEQADPVGSVRRMRELADEYGLELALGPDHSFALNDAVAMAPYVDIIVLQVQRVQTDHDTVRDFVLPLARELRAANPEIEISVQVRTEGDVKAIAELIDSMRDELDGISILTSPETTEVAEALVDELRPIDAATAPQPTAFTPTQLPKEAAKPRHTPTPLPTVEQPTPVAMSPVSSGNPWLIGAGLVVLSLLLSSVVAIGLLVGYRKLPRR